MNRSAPVAFVVRLLPLLVFCSLMAVWSVTVHARAVLPLTASPALVQLADAALIEALKAQAASAQEPSGFLEAVVEGDRLLLPALDVDYAVQIHGDLAAVTVVQSFSNPLPIAIAPRYLFPLSERAAVTALVMETATERVVGRFQRKAVAEATFAAAAKAGKVASLVRQQRPNQFTQRLANLMPGATVRVELRYHESLRKRDGGYELVLPLVVGPRFDPPQVPSPEDVPVPYAPVQGLTVQARADQQRVGVRVEIDAPVPVLGVDSPTHGLDVQRRGAQALALSLAAGRVPDNRDFVLRYQLGHESVSAGLQTHFEAGEGGYFSLLIEPPADLAPEALLPREMVFLLDCSGSMDGLPIEASKRFMRHALNGLRPTDSFRIIRFSDRATDFSSEPLAATPANISAGLAYTDQLRGGGGTVMSSGIYQALAAPIAPGVLRTVIFLTDGYIGNEQEILRLVREERQSARIYAFGVGTGVNRYLLESLAQAGRGFVRYLDPTQDSDEVPRALAARLAAPVLTDLTMDWGGLPVTDLAPKQLPDLYAGDSLRVSGRYAAASAGRFELSGRGALGPVRFGQDVALDDQEARPPLRQLWARDQVAQHMRSLATPVRLRRGEVDDAALRERVTVLGEQYGLLTRWTALVAVAETVVQPHPEATAPAQVALPQVAGVPASAYGTGLPAFAGTGTPEPGVGLGLGVTALGLLLARRRRENRQH